MNTKLELYQKVTPLAQLGIWERNLISGESYWNAIIYQIYGYNEEQPPSSIEQVAQLYIEPERFLTLISTAQTTGQPQIDEFEIKDMNGVYKWICIRIHSTSTGAICTSIYGTLEDITYEKRLMLSLSEKEERLRHAFDYAPIGMGLVSLSGYFLKCNECLSRLFGYSESELKQLTVFDVIQFEDSADEGGEKQSFLGYARNRYSTEKRCLQKDGQSVWVLIHVSLVRTIKQTPLYYVMQIKDITERKNKEHELNLTLATVSTQNERLLNFAHIISHNLRSHASNIKMLTEMIGDEECVDDRDSMMSMLKLNSDNLLRTLSDLSEVVDVDHSAYDKLQLINLAERVTLTVNMLSISLKKVDAEVQMDIDPEIQIYHKKAYLDSILLNLLTNCIKYKQFGSKLVIQLFAYDQNQYIVFQVRDNGAGIDLDKYKSKLFGLYSTFHSNKDAHGVGLFLVKNQVESLGGKIEVDSLPNVGTTFKVQFLKTH